MEPLTFKSQFNPNISIIILLSENPQYNEIKPIFEEFGYGFMVPYQNLIIIDGEHFIDNLDKNVLLFIEAHEIAHFILEHNKERNENDELDADLGAYLLLKTINAKDSIDILLENFEERHGICFNEVLLDRVKNSFIQ